MLDTDTFKEKISFQLSGMNLFIFFGITSLVLMFITALLLALTPLRELIPGYSNADVSELAYSNAKVVDSLEVQLHAQEELLADIQDIMMGRDPSQRHALTERSHGDSSTVEMTPYLHSPEDSLLRDEMRQRGGDRNYACPLQGKIISKFNGNSDVNGITIEGNPGDKVLSIQSGIVLMTDKGTDNVYTIVIQHSGVDLSIYKAAGSLTVSSGMMVQAGETIMQLKGSGGNKKPTLYFEMLKSGEAVNPSQWIVF